MQHKRRSRRLRRAAVAAGRGEAGGAKLIESSAAPASLASAFAATSLPKAHYYSSPASRVRQKRRQPVHYCGALDANADEDEGESAASAAQPAAAAAVGGGRGGGGGGGRASQGVAVSSRIQPESAPKVGANSSSSLPLCSSSSQATLSTRPVGPPPPQQQLPLDGAPPSSCPRVAIKRRRLVEGPAMPSVATGRAAPVQASQLGPQPAANAPGQEIMFAPVTRSQQQQRLETLQQQQAQQLEPQNQGEPNRMDLIKAASRKHYWQWNEQDKSEECLVSKDNLEVCFHPQTSASAAAIRAEKPLIKNGNYYYWEVTTFDKTYGTSVMFGLCTKQQQLHSDNYCNLIGLDKNGWSLSHKGLIWHDGKAVQYTKMFPTDQTVTVGLLFDTRRGELSFFMDGKNLGVAFRGLNNVNEELYPVVGSTAKCTRMRLVGSYRGFVSLLERSCFAVLSNSPDKNKLLRRMLQYQLPRNLIEYLAESAGVCSSQTKNTAQLDPYNWNNC